MNRWATVSICRPAETISMTNPLINAFNNKRVGLLAMGLFCVSTIIYLIGSASFSVVGVASESLEQYWRSSYDILVRPTGSRTAIEEKFGLVEGNHLSGIWGGITFDQYELIKNIPGIEIAAPIATVGYISAGSSVGNFQIPNEPGVYVVEQKNTTFDGIRFYDPPDYLKSIYYIWPPRPDLTECKEGQGFLFGIACGSTLDYPRIVLNPSPMASGNLTFPFLIAAIDPEQEDELIGLSQAVVQGRYLTEDESIESHFYDVQGNPLENTITLPALINAQTYVSVLALAEFSKVELPNNELSAEEIREMGGAEWLDTLPHESIEQAEIDQTAVYDTFLLQNFGLDASTSYGGSATQSVPGPLVYQETAAPAKYQGLTLALQLPGPNVDPSWPNYRLVIQASYNSWFFWSIPGILDIEKIPLPPELIGLPLETYFPPKSTLLYDEEGMPVSEPIEIKPTTNLAGYIQPPPSLLTTLDAARALRGDAAISAIRVRVSGIDELNPASQRKIEAIASEIVRQTGLDVDIMVGSAPTRVLVHVPYVGYVEELWIKKGANLEYREEISTGHLFLLGGILTIGGLFAFDMTWTEIIAEKKQIALQKALGWRSKTVLTRILGRFLLLGGLCGLFGVLLGMGINTIIGGHAPIPALVVGIPLATITVSIIAAVFPALMASRIPPTEGLRSGELKPKSGGRVGRVTAISDYALQGLTGRRGRTVMSLLMVVLSSVLLSLVLGILYGQQGLLSGTLLGEFILIHLSSFHILIAATGFILAGFSIANSILAGVIQRRREIGVLKAVGWRDKKVATLFIWEGVIVSAAGGFLGILIGGELLYLQGKSISYGLGAIAMVVWITAIFVGAMAALYPAWLAAFYSPSQSLRNE